jgi:outer membrane protein TolC
MHYSSKKTRRIKSILGVGILTGSIFINTSVLADTQVKVPSSLSDLIELGLKNSLAPASARMEVDFQKQTESATSGGQKIPSLSLSASYGRYIYDQPYITTTGTPESNNGQRTALSLTISYDLQKLFSGESAIAKQTTYLAKIQEKITVRDVVRNVKIGYFSITEIRDELVELNKLILLFERIDGILQKQKKIGIDNTIERKQFQIQKSILASDLEARMSDLDAAYSQLSLTTNIEVEKLKELIPNISKVPELHFANQKNLNAEKVASIEDFEILENLGRDYSLAKLDYEKYNSLALPNIYIKGSRENPTMPSAEGPQTITEVGISLSLDSFFSRTYQKSALGAKAQKLELLYKKSLLDYRNQIRLNVRNLNRLKTQTASLEMTRTETKSLIDKSFLYYSQRRLDVLGVLDIFQKYLQAAKNSLTNKRQIQMADAELEYLVGGGAK